MHSSHININTNSHSNNHSNNHSNTLKNPKGFTLLELMITLAVAGILATMALPPLINWVQNKKSQQNTQQILNVLKAARQTAVATKASETLTFTPSNYNNSTKVALTIAQAGSVNRNHTFSSPINFIQVQQGNGGGNTINQIRFNGFGLPQASIAGNWSNNRVRVLLADYGITFDQQGVSDICVRNATMANASMPACTTNF